VTLLIDGHNLIGRMPDLSLSDPADEEALVARLRIVAGRTRRRITVVFDPGMGHGLASKGRSGGVSVVYAGAGRTADEVILRRVRSARNRRAITVVTSDRPLGNQVQAEGAAVKSCEDFIREWLIQPAPDAEADEDQARVQMRPDADNVDYWLAEFSRARRKKGG